MNKQFLGDERDLFKFDLIKEIIQGISKIEFFTYIPMLTDNDYRRENHGNKRNLKDAKAGSNNELLIDFLEEYKNIPIKDRTFYQIKRYFKELDIDTEFYQENEIFNNANRFQYFKNIPYDLLSKSLIFIDPDTGLQPKKSLDEKHILYWEVSYLYEKMDKDSLLMIYQHKLHEKRFFSNVKKILKTNIGDSPIYISDKSVAFFFLTKNGILKEDLNKILEEEYTKNNPDLIFEM